MSGSAVTLEKLKAALVQPNLAIRKRALAIIFNEVRVEAATLIQEYVGRETHPDLQALGLKVLAKLKDFEEKSSVVPLDRLLSLLQHPNPDSRLLALRAMANHVAPGFTEVVLPPFHDATNEEVLGILCGIIKNNPSTSAIPFLIKTTEHESEKIRFAALEGLISIIFGCMYPHVLKALLDPSSQLKMKAYQVISNISRANLLEALTYMLENQSAGTTQLAGKLLPSFLGPDLIPLLEKHLEHPDADTAGYCKRGLLLLAQKGHFEAVQILEKINRKGKGGPPEEGGNLEGFPGLGGFPRYICEPLLQVSPLLDATQIVQCLRDTYARLSNLLNAMFISAYFQFGNRSDSLNRLCFQSLHQGIDRADFSKLLTSLGSALPRPSDKNDLFPVVLADQVQNDFNNRLADQVAAFRQKAELVNDGTVEASAILKPLQAGLAAIFSTLRDLPNGKIALKVATATGVKIFDFMKPKPLPIDPKLLMNFELPTNVPVLISPNSSRSLVLAPFYFFDQATQQFMHRPLNENDLWDFLTKHQALEPFLSYLKEKPT